MLYLLCDKTLKTLLLSFCDTFTIHEILPFHNYCYHYYFVEVLLLSKKDAENGIDMYSFSLWNPYVFSHVITLSVLKKIANHLFSPLFCKTVTFSFYFFLNKNIYKVLQHVSFDINCIVVEG